MKLKLSAPTTVFFLISLVLVIVGVLAVLGVIHNLPIAPFWLAVTGYAVLAFGNVAKGL